jgi:tetratricopeptide (TPR) repeat protein
MSGWARALRFSRHVVRARITLAMEVPRPMDPTTRKPHAAPASEAVRSPRLERLAAMLDIDRANVRLRRDAIQEAMACGLWQQAAEWAACGLDGQPDHAGLLVDAAFVHLATRRYDDAAASLAQALRLEPEANVLRYNLAFAHFMKDEHAQALDQLSDQVVHTVPAGLALRARCQHRLGHPAQAEADCRRRLAADPADAEVQGLLALLLYERQETAETVRQATLVLRGHPRQLEALLALASCQADELDFDAARATFCALLEAHPGCGRGWLGLALADLAQMRLDDARAHAAQAGACMPTHIGTWHVLAWACILLDDVDAAAAAFERALEIDRGFADTHGGLAVVAALQGRDAQAHDALRRAHKLGPQSMAARYAQVVLLQREGRHDEARAIVEAASEANRTPADRALRERVAEHMLRREQIAAPAANRLPL